MSDPFELRRVPGRASWGAVVLWAAGLVFGCFLLGGGLLALLTQVLDSNDRINATAVACFGAVIVVLGAAGGRRQLPRLLSRAVSLRLDDHGVALLQGEYASEDGEDLWTLHVPWRQVASVSLTHLAPGDAPEAAFATGVDCLRFTLVDDSVLVLPPRPSGTLRTKAALLGLTPAQTRLVLLLTPGRLAEPSLTDWLRRNRPHLPVLEGTRAPWSTSVNPVDPVDPVNPEPGATGARVAVVGGHGRLGQLVLARLVAGEDVAPVALVRNEAHRAELERLGAEVRMLDVARQGPAGLVQGVRGCSSVVYLARGTDDRPQDVDHHGVRAAVEALPHAGLDRLVVVVGPHATAADAEGTTSHDVVAHLAASDLAWTALRPAVLTDGPGGGEVLVGDDVEPGAVTRADLADVVVAALRDDTSVRGDFGVVGVTSG